MDLAPLSPRADAVEVADTLREWLDRSERIAPNKRAALERAADLLETRAELEAAVLALVDETNALLRRIGPS